jgi:natural product biosynthesis luciferase-like monooxygenase protein
VQQPHLIDQNQNWHGNAAPPVFSTLVDIARHRARAKGSDAAYIFLGDGEVEEATLTYVELDQKARVIAVELQALEAEGQRVLLLYPPGLEFIAGFLGCLYAGSVAVPANPSGYARTVGMLEALLVDARPHVALTTATMSARLERLMASCSAWKSLRRVITEDLSSSRAAQWREKAVHQEQLALLQYTSGSTAAAKGVMVTHRNLMENERLIQQVFGQSEESLVVSWLPFFHDMGLIGGILQPLFVGARCVLMPPAAFLKRPANWLEAISRYRATTSGGPNFGYQYCLQKVTPEQRRRLDLSSWRVAFNGSEPVRHETLQRFAEQFAESGFRREAFHPCYGLAEATLLVAGQQRANGPVLRQFSRVSMNGREVMQPEVDEIQGVTLAGSGAVPEGHTVLIVDPESLAPQLEGAVGEICVRGPSVARGYWNQPAETGRVFDAHISGLDGAFLRTGDLGFFHDGELFVTGRLKDLIIIRGVNYHPHDIERIAEESHPCVRALTGAAFSAEIAGEERLVILQETVTAGQEETAAAIQSIREAVGMAFELQPYAVVLVRARTLLRTTSGKIRRSACRRAFLDSDLQVVRAWQEDATVAGEQQAPAFDTQEGAQAWLVARIASRLGVAADALRLDIPLAACGVDSLGVMELMHDVEGLGASIPMLSLLECSGIADLAHQVFTSWRARSAPNPPPAARAERAPMQATSHGQKSLWLAQQIAPQSAAYNLSVAARIRSPLDIGALRRALEALSRRHDGLRSTFPAANGQPFQQIHEALAIPFEEHAFSQSTADANDEELRRALSRRASLPFRLDRDPAWRVDLYCSSGRAAVILLTAHHIIADFRSLEVCLRDIAILYAAELQGGSEMLPTPAVHYGDFVRWQEGVLASQKGEELWSYWQNQLSGDMPSLDLPTDHPRQAAQTYAGASEGLRLGGDLTARLRALARSQGCTLYTVLLGGLQALLCRYTSQDEFVVGTPALGRPQEAFQDVLGYFVNAVALRLRSAGHATFEEILGRARTVILGAFQHQDYPFSLLVERLRPVREPGRNPIFQVMFTHLATRGSDADVAAFALGEPSARLSMGGLDLEPLAVENQDSPFDLALMTGESGQDVIARLQYNSALFDSPTMASMLGHWKAMLNSAVSEPQRTIFDLTILTPSEHQELLGLSTSTQVEYPAGSCIHELFETQVNRTPARIAVTAADARLTYRELSCRADRLAGYLRSLGAGPDIPVGVCLERSSDIVVALLAVLKAGAAYVPIDPVYPKERLAFMVEDARIPLVVTRSSFHALFQPSDVRLVSLDTDAQRIETSVAEPVMSAAGPDNLAYIIYTSGSTGLPKGVMIAHRNVANFFSGMDCRLGSESGTFLAVTSISFDISVLELLWTLCRGFEVIVQRPSEAAAGRRSSRRMDFSLFYFASDADGNEPDKYRLLLEGAKFADANGFTAVWTPERHFHVFGGLFPNPSVTSAAVAAVTTRIQIRAGSVVLPLHHPVRVAEEWSVVDNLSNGRVGISFASGWHADDFFVFAPQHYSDRKQRMIRDVETVRKLWRGESVRACSGAGREIDVRIVPRPVQPELPVWITAAGSEETFRAAGEMGCGVLTHLLGQSLEELAAKIAIYRAAWKQAGHVPGEGKVTLMLHAYVGENLTAVRETVRRPFCQYLRHSVNLISNLARSLNLDISPENWSEADMQALLGHAFDRYFQTSGLMGTPEMCLETVGHLKEIEVDEVACLIDFGVDTDSVLRGLTLLNEVRQRSAESTAPKREVTHLQCTPSMARMLLAAPDTAEMLRSLRKLMVGGEELPLPVLEALQRVTNAEIHNMYGPTETTVWSSTELTGCESGAVSIGRPIANTWIVVLDQSLRLAPRGVVGEICIGGGGLARGYLGRPELTAEKFIPDAITGRSGERLYRTGDLGRFNRSGKVEFLGRKDRQVKIRGYRVEPGEIEVALAQHPSVRESAVIAQSDASGGQRLVCFAVAAPEHPIAAADLRHFLSGKLPDYMIPSTFVLLDKLPSTPNGKLDRGALSAMRVDETASGAGYVSPRTALEQIVAGIWAELLRLERVGLGENFFEIGGHSLLAVQVTTRLRELFHVEAPLGGFLANPTVEGLCACISLEGGDELERMAEVLKSVIELSEEEVEAMLTQESIAMSSQTVVSR